MSIKKEELEIIGEYVQSHLSEWLPPRSQTNAQGFYPVEVGERIVRVEEELKNQRELMKQGFDHMDKRLDQIQFDMDRRFEQVDKRFDEANTRFEAISAKIFNFMIWSFGSTVTVAGIVIAVIKFS